jgi:hypothetical protein
MAGLDPASSATRLLVEALLERKDERSGRISFDSFLKVVWHAASCCVCKWRAKVNGCRTLSLGLPRGDEDEAFSRAEARSKASRTSA